MKTKTDLDKMDEAKKKAWKALSGYKFMMFGYWAAIWVHYAKDQKPRPQNPFSCLVKEARQHT
jgi:hypothetical protein